MRNLAANVGETFHCHRHSLRMEEELSANQLRGKALALQFVGVTEEGDWLRVSSLRMLSPARDVQAFGA